jgi:hypothetical protein
MNLNLKAEGGDSRRNFFEKLAALAAASSVAASAQQPPAGGGAAGRGGRGGPRANPAVREPGPLAKEPMPMVKFGKYEISRLIMGSNGPGAHFSVKEGMDARAYLTPEKVLEENRHMEELGINCMEDSARRMGQYNKENGGKMLIATRNSAPLDESIKPGRGAREIAQTTGCFAIHHGGAGDTGTDAWWRRGKLSRVREWCKNVKDAGVLCAVTSHRPEVFMEIESQGWTEVDYYMTCLYKYGRTHSEWLQAYKSNPEMMPVEIGYPTEGNSEWYGGEIAFVQGDPPEMLKVVKQTKKPCWVYKLLASTRLTQREDIVEDRFKYILSNIKSTDAVVVGMWGKYSDEFALNKEYVIKYGGTSVKVS